MVQSNQLAMVYLTEVHEWMLAHPTELVVFWLSKHGSECATGQDAFPGVTIKNKQVCLAREHHQMEHCKTFRSFRLLILLLHLQCSVFRIVQKLITCVQICCCCTYHHQDFWGGVEALFSDLIMDFSQTTINTTSVNDLIDNNYRAVGRICLFLLLNMTDCYVYTHIIL
jgi:hypothetical protein